MNWRRRSGRGGQGVTTSNGTNPICSDFGVTENLSLQAQGNEAELELLESFCLRIDLLHLLVTLNLDLLHFLYLFRVCCIHLRYRSFNWHHSKQLMILDTFLSPLVSAGE